MRLSRNCLAQDSILITESISRKRYTRERRNIKEIGNNYIEKNTMWIIVGEKQDVRGMMEEGTYGSWLRVHG